MKKIIAAVLIWTGVYGAPLQLDQKPFAQKEQVAQKEQKLTLKEIEQQIAQRILTDLADIDVSDEFNRQQKMAWFEPNEHPGANCRLQLDVRKSPSDPDAIIGIYYVKCPRLEEKKSSANLLGINNPLVAEGWVKVVRYSDRYDLRYSRMIWSLAKNPDGSR